MAEKDDNHSQVSDNKFAYLNELHLTGIERQITAGEYVSGPVLATALRKHGFRPIRPEVLEYLCRHLEDNIAKPRGRKAIPEIVQRRQRMIIRHYYQRYLAWLQARKRRYGGLKGWPRIRQADWWKGPPHERAARMTAEQFSYGAESWRTVLNEVSSQK